MIPKKIWAVIGSIVILLSLFQGVAWLYPRLQVTAPGEPADPSQPFLIPFQLTNQGHLPVYSVTSQCLIHALSFVATKTCKNNCGSAQANSVLVFSAGTLLPGEKQNISCSAFQWDSTPQPRLQITHAEIGFLSDYYPLPLIPWRWSVFQVFIGSLSADGTFEWQEYVPSVAGVPHNGLE